MKRVDSYKDISHNNGKIIFSPFFESPINRELEFSGVSKNSLKFKQEEVRQKVGVRGKKNIGHYFVHLVSALYGGFPTDYLYNQPENIGNGYKRNFNPDIAETKDKNITYSEVKATSTRTGSFEFGIGQLENYTYAILRDYDKGLIPVWNNYLLKYGNRSLIGVNKLEDDNLSQTLSHNVRYLMKIPSNFLFALLTNAVTLRKNQVTSKRPQVEVKRKIHGTTFSALLNKDGLDLFLENFDVKEFSPQDFFLDKLNYKRYSSENKGQIIVKSGKLKYNLSPFEIIEYNLSKRNEKKWVEFLSQNHEKICEHLGLEDLFHHINCSFPWESEEELDDIPF